MVRNRLITTAVVLASMSAVLVLGLCMVYVGSQMAGSFEGYERFLSGAAPVFLLWRVLMYVFAVVVWLSHYRQRVVHFLKQDSDGGYVGLTRLRRLEYTAIGFVLLIELYNLNTAWGQA